MAELITDTGTGALAFTVADGKARLTNIIPQWLE